MTHCIWDLLPKLFGLVREAHQSREMDGTGHPFDHVVQVAQTALIIAEDPLTARLAGAAALCHNADRLLQKEINASKEDSESHAGARMINPAETEFLMRQWLDGSGEFTAEEVGRIVYAVSLHSGFNIEDCDPILVALQDADRITCSMASVIMDAAQFWNKLPSIDPKWITANPKDAKLHSYRNPKSVAHNLECRLDWIDKQSKVCVRLPRAWEMMERRVGFYRQFLAEIASQRAEIDLHPEYPQT